MAQLEQMCYNEFRQPQGGGTMSIEDGAWIMRGLDWDDPSRIQSWEGLIEWIGEVGFLPLFKNEVDGFSAEENTSDLYW